MNQANRKTKLSKYTVTVTREIEHVATVEVEARSVEEAEDIAVNVVDGGGGHYRREGDVVSQTVKAKVQR